MTAKFFAVGSFHIPSRNLFVIVGDLLEGSARAGMEFSVALNPGLSVTAKIARVEVVDVVHMGKSYLGLAVAYDDPGELDFWKALNISDEIIELHDVEPPAV